MPVRVLNWWFSDLFQCLKKRIEDRVPLEIILQLDRSLRPGVHGVLEVPYQGGPLTIHINPSQSATLAELSAAHEYFHIELLSEGFPHAIPTSGHDTWRDVAGRFFDTFQDPLVFSRMEKFGYSVRTEYRRLIRHHRKQLETTYSMPGRDNWLEYCWHTFGYVGSYIELPPRYRQEFASLFQERYPQLAKEAGPLVSTLESTKFDNPADCAQLMRQVLRQYNLQGILQLYYPPWSSAPGPPSSSRPRSCRRTSDRSNGSMPTPPQATRLLSPNNGANAPFGTTSTSLFVSTST